MEKVLISASSFGQQDASLLGRLEEAGYERVMNPHARRLTEAEIHELIQAHRPVGLLAGLEPLTRETLSQAPFLRTISRVGVGLDSVDLAAAKELGITVSNTPDAPTIPVAELTLGMMLGLLRAIPRSDASIRAGGWERPMGRLISGMTIGIIGCGRIGTRVGRILQAFGCSVIGYDPYLEVHPLWALVPLDDMLSEADLVTLHVPYTQANQHLISRARLQRMKPGAYLVNASRGGLVDEQALFEALKGDRLGGAALDCFDQEPYAGPLAGLPNTLLTGHIGSYAKEGRAIMEQQAMANLLQALAAKP
jgi:D-3-phosphoglycerate dehydrogenase